ncbi:MAG: hypothetical protein DMF89_12775 [Acidobacteria bacterium]|nr:MAG: hypothetical protein DMF90_00215 [Acidobacteriota bacterium]PYR49326.1 MAG: hypothetical protein DMF89_12775 [Acidobacteriota bacterium]
MSGIAGYLVATLVLAALGGASLAAGFFDRGMARAQEDFAARKYDAPDATLETAERYLAYGERIPWISRGPLHDVRVRRATVHYWQRQYDDVASQALDSAEGSAAQDAALELVVANAKYRKAQGGAKDRQSTLQALDVGINAYAGVLKNSSRQDEAAYNYEYLVRLREEVDKGRRKPGLPEEQVGPLGYPGSFPAAEGNMKDFKTFIPLESDEKRDAGAAAKAPPMKRKG